MCSTESYHNRRCGKFLSCKFCENRGAAEPNLVLSWNSVYVNCFLDTGFAKSRESSVGIALGYGLEDRVSRVRFPVEAGNFSLYHCVQNGSGAHPASCPMGTRGSFPGGKTAGA
jgi:hypothetical protein